LYRSELNAGIPLELLAKEYHKHLAVSFTNDDGMGFVSNQAVEDLLSKKQLMKSIQYEIEQEREEIQYLRNKAIEDDEIDTRIHHKPSRDDRYEFN